MKNTIFSLALILIISMSVFSQEKGNTEYQEIKVDKKYKDICDGFCLQQEDFISNKKTEAKFTLMRKKTMTFYLFKEEGKPFPSIDIYEPSGKHIKNYECFYEEEKNFMYIKYKSQEHALFTVKLNFKDNKKAKATVVMCMKKHGVIVNRIHQPNAPK